jgi:hypothetical protein
VRPRTKKKRPANESLFDLKISAAGHREIRAAGAFTVNARKQFDRLGLITARSERVSHDLGDIHGVCLLLSSRLQRIMAQRSLNVDRTQRMLTEIERELYIHLPYHLRLLRRPLERLIEDLSEGKIGKPAPRTRRVSAK